MIYQSDFKLKATDLRNLSQENIERSKTLPRNNINIVLHNIVDTYNIGSAFRIADSINASKVWLCGNEVTTPSNKQVQKSSLNTCFLVEWEHISSIDLLFQQNGIFIALEELSSNSEFEHKAKSLAELSNQKIYESDVPVFIIIGSERFGISENVLEKSNMIVSIPMYGVNTSMNVINALAIVCYFIFGK
jgi:tRNA G18 (ribose-2'-O)-methylase SpoU